jgi:hypothetical protein
MSFACAHRQSSPIVALPAALIPAKRGSRDFSSARLSRRWTRQTLHISGQRGSPAHRCAHGRKIDKQKQTAAGCTKCGHCIADMFTLARLFFSQANGRRSLGMSTRSPFEACLYQYCYFNNKLQTERVVSNKSARGVMLRNPQPALLEFWSGKGFVPRPSHA